MIEPSGREAERTACGFPPGFPFIVEGVAMIAMRRSVACVGLLLLIGCQDPSADPTAQQPTAQQLKAAQDAFAMLGASHKAFTNPHTKKTFHIFFMPRDTTDADLKRLPNPPFPFALSLYGTHVTDAGLMELKNLKALITLNLIGTRVTGAGLKELRQALPGCKIRGR